MTEILTLILFFGTIITLGVLILKQDWDSYQQTCCLGLMLFVMMLIGFCGHPGVTKEGAPLFQVKTEKHYEAEK